jgi:hypothetical protein
MPANLVDLDPRETAATGRQSDPCTNRRPYEAPRVWFRGTVERSTLLSGAECVLDPPPC